ncbi:MAG: DUF3179 domain-containing protein [Candidatus Paceibacterota bacterium]
MSNATFWVIVIALLILVGISFFFLRGERFALPNGETHPFTSEDVEHEEDEVDSIKNENITMSTESGENKILQRGKSTREVFATDGTKHSIPLNEILAGGPPKDGIPSIDNPKFTGVDEADKFLTDESIGLVINYKGEKRFYPYQILVWHEIVNDAVAGDPLLVTYCPLCQTGIVFERRVNGEEIEFGVSGLLWQSNLLMYDRQANEENESLWSQVLGEAVLGPQTGERLAIVSSDTVKYGDWKEKNPDTQVLSRDTGTSRNYTRDPYGDYYTNNDVSFGATFDDDRLHPKEFVLGVELNGKFKAYHAPSLPEGTTTDQFAGETITLEKSDIGEVRMFIEGEEIQYIGGFWFSWLAVHPNTNLYTAP